MNQRIPSASTAEFFNTIGAKRMLGTVANSQNGRLWNAGLGEGDTLN
jgi:hypothetical protein